MSTTNKLLELLPADLWVFNGTSFDNVIGDNTVTGTPVADITIDKCNSSSARFQAGAVGTVGVPVFDAGGAEKSFAIGGQFMVSGSEDITLLGTGAGEGLSYTSGKYKFATNQNGTEYAAEVEYVNLGNALIFGVHEPSANYLFINGELVASVSIPAADQDQDFLNTTGTLLVGSTSGSSSVLVDNICVVYGTPSTLTLASAYSEMFVESIPDNENGVGGGTAGVVASKTGLPSEFVLDVGNKFQNMFLNGVAVDTVSTVGNVITPVYNGSTTVAGQAYAVIPIGMEDGVSVTVAGSSISWSGSGTVEASVDGGNTYSPCSNGDSIPNVPGGTDMANKDVIIRVTFAGGGSYLSEYMYNLTGNVYTRSDITADSVDAEVSSGTTLSDSRQANDYSGNWGSGRVTISQPAFNYAAAEMLVRVDNSSGTQTIFQVGDLVSPLYLGILGGWLDSAGITGVVINGTYSAPPSFEVYDGQVIHMTALFPYKAGEIYLLADHNNANPFKGGFRIFNIYESLTQAEAESLYEEHLQRKTLVVSEPVSTIGITHSTLDVVMYNADTILSVS